MSVVPAIAVNVFRESVRDKVLYNLVAFSILLMGASYLIGQLTARPRSLMIFMSCPAVSCPIRYDAPMRSIANDTRL